MLFRKTAKLKSKHLISIKMAVFMFAQLKSKIEYHLNLRNWSALRLKILVINVHARNVSLL